MSEICPLPITVSDTLIFKKILYAKKLTLIKQLLCIHSIITISLPNTKFHNLTSTVKIQE